MLKSLGSLACPARQGQAALPVSMIRKCLAVMTTASEPTFACDAMLGGLARWLRAAGYEAFWRGDIGDRDLIDLAQREGRVLLTSDTGILRYGVVRDGEVAHLFIPHGLRKRDQLGFVLRQLQLPVRAPRCMACGGELIEVPKEQVRDRVPARTFAWVDRFFICGRCHHLFWQGTHWQRIAAVLDTLAQANQNAS